MSAATGSSSAAPTNPTNGNLVGGIPVLKSPKIVSSNQNDYYKFNSSTTTSPIRSTIQSSQNSSRFNSSNNNNHNNGFLEPLSPSVHSTTSSSSMNNNNNSMVPQTFGKYINLPSFSTLSSSKKSPNSTSHQANNFKNNLESKYSSSSSSRPTNHIQNPFDKTDEESSQCDEDFLNGSSNSVEGAGSKIKFADLGSKITAIDAQVAQQEKVRKKRQMQLESIESKIDSINSYTNKVNSRVDTTNNSLEKLETQLYLERGSRETSEKNIVHLIEEKFNQLTSKIDQEKNIRIQENDIIKKRLKSIEEDIGTIHLHMDTLSQELSTQSHQLHLLSTNYNSFVNQYKNERRQLADSIATESKESQIKFGEVKQKINNMEIEILKQISSLTNLSNIHIHDISNQLEKLYAEIGIQTRQSVDPLWAKIEQFQNSMESQKINTSQQFNNVQQYLNSQKLEIISDYIQPTSEKLERLIVQNDKQGKKNLFELRAEIEKQQENTGSSLSKLQERIVTEEKSRGESEAHLLALLSKTMSRIKNTIESPNTDPLINEID